jgi:hypothetical protein
MSSLAFYASPVDYRNNDLENKIISEKKLDKKALQILQDTVSKSSETYSPMCVSDIHKNLKADNENELFKFYNNELSSTNQHVNPPPIIKTDQYLLMDEQSNVEKYNKKTNSNQDVIEKLNRMIEMFEEQKEIKTTKKNEEIILYCFLGVFTIYIIDSFVSIGKYSR